MKHKVNWQLCIGGFLVLTVACLAMLAPYIVVHDPLKMDFSQLYQAPSLAYPFGTDGFGRDLLSRVLYGTRVSIYVSASVAILTGVLGGLVGLVAGYYKRLDGPLMRLMDSLMAIPSILLAISIVAVLGPSALNAMLALTVVYTPRTARVIRSSVLQFMEKTFIEAARAIGVSNLRILIRHIIPNCASVFMVQQTFIIAYAIVIEAGLSFVGAGAPPPAPSLGNLLSEGRVAIRSAPWLVVIPGLAILIFVVSINLLGDGLREFLESGRAARKG